MLQFLAASSFHGLGLIDSYATERDARAEARHMLRTRAVWREFTLTQRKLKLSLACL